MTDEELAKFGRQLGEMWYMIAQALLERGHLTALSEHERESWGALMGKPYRAPGLDAWLNDDSERQP